MNYSRFKTLLLFLPLCLSVVFAQTVDYTIEENAPKAAKLSIGLVPLDFFLLDGEPMGGPGVNVYFRPTDRIKIQSRISSALYLNDARSTDELPGLKKLGGLFGEVHGEYVWLKKGINLTDANGDLVESQFNIKQVSTGLSTETKYINFPYNRVIERSIRVGGFYNNYPLANNTQNASGVFFGLSRTGRRYARLNFEGYGEKEQGSALGYYVDLMFGGVSAVDPSAPVASSSGFRVGFDVEFTGGLMPIGTTLELGKMPGANGYMRLMFTFALQSGSHSYTGSYKTRKAPSRKIPALIRAL